MKHLLRRRFLYKAVGSTAEPFAAGTEFIKDKLIYKVLDDSLNGVVKVAVNNSGSTGAVIIPETVNDACITNVGETAVGNGYTYVVTEFYPASGWTSAFNGAKSLVIPPTITEIPSKKFSNCYALVSVSMPGVTSIGDYGFLEAKKLDTVDLSHVSYFGFQSFFTCSVLGTIDLSGLTNPASLKGNAFNKIHSPINLTLSTFLDFTFNELKSRFQAATIDGVERIDVNLTVPANLVDTFKSSAAWKMCRTINGVDYSAT